MATLAAEGRAGKAMVTFLMEVIGLGTEEVDALRATPPDYDILAVLSATLPREGRALLGLDLPGLASGMTCPVMCLLGERSPDWARTITHSTAAVIPGSEIAVLPGLGHEAIDAAPDLVVAHLVRFLD